MKWNASPVGAVATGRLGDEHSFRSNRSIERSQNRLPIPHPFADRTLSGFNDHQFEGFGFTHAFRGYNVAIKKCKVELKAKEK